MKFKTQETRDKNNVIKLYKGRGNFWPYQVFRLPNPSTLPSSSRPSLSHPPARMYHLRRSPFGVWPEPSSYAGRYLLTKRRVQRCCRYKSFANNSVPPNCSRVTQTWESGILSNSPGVTLKVENTNRAERLRRKDKSFQIFPSCVF